MNERKEAMKASLQATSGASRSGLRSPEQGSEHTPGPWHWDVSPEHSWDVQVWSSPNDRVCFLSHDLTSENVAGQANAARIVQCVNSHDDLVAALAWLHEEAVKVLEGGIAGPDLEAAVEGASEALLKAKGEA